MQELSDYDATAKVDAMYRYIKIDELSRAEKKKLQKLLEQQMHAIQTLKDAVDKELGARPVRKKVGRRRAGKRST